MIEIERTDKRKSIKDRIKSAKKKKGEISLKQTSFYDKLLEVQDVESAKLELDQLLEEIDSAGREFAHTPTLETLRKYKSLVKGFLETVIKKIYKIKEKMGRKYWLKQKVYIVIEKINDRLEKLTNYILKKEAEHIDLLATLDEIRGLLVDMYK
ncbi:MAG: YaaR family protein [Spirochaetes bacterium]|nr:YaaR family protein [Spirochaetota bacterium]